MLVKTQVKYIQSLSQKKLRDEEGVFVAEGPKIVEELLQAGNTDLVQLYAEHEWIQKQAFLPQNAVQTVTSADLERISFLQTPHQVLGIFRKPAFPTGLSLRNKISLMLDTIQDPGNLGTIIRCADWFGISTVICSRDSADVFNPKVVQSTMAGIARVRVLYEELPQFLQQHSDIPVYAATLNGTPLPKLGQLKEGILLIGNESKGISNELLGMSSHKITIPRIGKAESLNAAVATGIILSHIV
ncbi:RNA methyltransferase [Pseudoflavitalea rhizosphaerae]|uniref:RNA methyltransferase n=1 Tax=Pseudoflavitalea rhizosphaerae TaxID=1884793 RepID=UPI000F8C6492|nr:RNA methyltransferase [Pseudoflavitalea rhizosphaerae]